MRDDGMTLRNFAFIGPRGAGKSRLSRKFAKRLDRLLLSTDTLISYEAGGLPIRDIVAAEGWAGFREREYRLLEKVAGMPAVVIDCGGGILVDVDADGSEYFSERKAALLREKCTTIYLKRSVQWLLSRELDSSHRPTLAADYEAVLRRRLPWYEKAADYVLDLSGRDVNEGIEELLFHFRDKS
jgi:shikimate kinase